MGFWVFSRFFYFCTHLFVYFVYWRCDEERHSPWQSYCIWDSTQFFICICIVMYLYFSFMYFVYCCGGSRWRCDEERHSPWQWRGAIYIAILSDPGIKERKITIYWQQGNILGKRFFFHEKGNLKIILTLYVRPIQKIWMSLFVQISKDVVVFH